MKNKLSRCLPWFRRLAWLFGAWAILCLSGWLLLPGLLQSQLHKMGSEALGRRVTVGSVEFKPWTLELWLRDLSIASADGSAPQFSIKQVYVNAELESLVRGAPVIDTVLLESPRLTVQHLGEGRYDFDDLLKRFSKGESGGSTPSFAVFNIALRDGSLVFQDQVAKRQHVLNGLEIGIPFLSNMEAWRDVTVAPRVRFSLNGSEFDSGGAVKPFAQNRSASLDVKIAKFDLTPYLAYQPKALPVQIKSAVLDADLKIDFRQEQRPVVVLRGRLGANDIGLNGWAARELLSVKSLQVQLAEVRPLEQIVKLEAVLIDAPELNLARDRQGRLLLPVAAADSAEKASKPATAPVAAEVVRSPTWQLELAKLGLHRGRIIWNDESVSPRAQWNLDGVDLQASGLAWPAQDVASFQGSLPLPGRSAAALKFSGEVRQGDGQLQASVDQLSLSPFAGYVSTYLNVPVNGTVGANAQARWKGQDVQLAVPQVRLKNFALGDPTTPLAGLDELVLSGGKVDLGKRRASLDRIDIKQPKMTLSRDAAGHWMFESWLKPQAPQASGVPKESGPAHAWQAVVKSLDISGGGIRWRDQLASKPVALDLAGLQLKAGPLALQPSEPVALTVSAQLQASADDVGSLAFKGRLTLAPLALTGQMDASQLPLHALEPYFGAALNVEVLRAQAGFHGQLAIATSAAGPEVKVLGDASLEDLRVNALMQDDAKGPARQEELLNWKALSLRGLDLALAPGSPGSLSIAETVLSDFYARVIVMPNGRLNLQDLVKRNEASGKDTALAKPAEVPAVPSAAAPAMQLRFGPMQLTQGRVQFSDRFIQPNYSASLSELKGRIGSLSSAAIQPGAAAELADVELHGRAEGTALLDIVGKLNPLAQPPQLDIKGKVRELELPPLSPYTIKYAGHGIERGKLSVDVAYLIRPDGQLQASNNIVLNQLSFGDKVEGAPNSLPVKLAVALLADRNGVIDINLPISGSLNDPQFRLGPIIFKVIVNLVVKAITSPFSLLASAFGGGGDELSSVGFAAGSAALDDAARQRLDKIAKAMSDRPSLRLTVTGSASLETERDSLRREQLQALLQTERRRLAVVSGAKSMPSGEVGAEEYPALLKEVYRRSEIKKPRNAIGMAKDVAPAEMEALLLASLDVSEQAARDLAQRRAAAVRDHLLAQKLTGDRLFLGSAKLIADTKGWSPRSELNLSIP